MYFSSKLWSQQSQSNSLSAQIKCKFKMQKKWQTHLDFFRSLKKVETNALVADLNRIPCSILDTYSNDLDEMLNTWIKLVLDVFDTHTPIRKKRVKSPDRPSWLTNEIQEAIKHRDHLKKLLDHGKIPRATLNEARTKVVHMVNN